MTETPIVAEVETHGEWLIWYQQWPIENRTMDWHFAHKNASEGNGLFGNDESREMCLQSIDWLEEQEREAQTEAGQERERQFVDAGMRSLNRALLYHALKQVMALPGIRNLPGFATGTHLQSADFALEQYEEQSA